MKKIVFLLLTVCFLTLSACNQTDSGSSSETSTDISSNESLPSSEEITSSEQSTSSKEGQSSEINKNPGSSATESTGKPSSNQAISSQTPRPVAKVTIPEGSSFMEIASALENAGVCSKSAFYQAAQSYTVQSFSVPSSSDRCFKMEGYLFPDTYEFYKNDNPTDVLVKMLNNYAAKSGMPSDSTLILASIIEKEARSDENMKMVSSVFHNRLNAAMKLEADPTRDYVNKNITGNSLVANQSKYAPLYNTYKCAKLPAGPICSPGARAIAAAQNPAAGNYLFFFFGNDNQNHYSSTLEEHQASMQQYGVQYGNSTD